MQCPSCGFENPDRFKFCGNCAAPFTGACPQCNFQNPPGLSFCGNCAAPLAPTEAGDHATIPPPAPPLPIATHPTSFANGRYQVKEFLGEGGKKRVYRGHDSVLDRDVALAVIKVDGLDPTSRIRITREAQALGRLGDHPHVLSIHDLGDEAGQPYMVLPLMPGGDIEGLLESAQDHRLPPEQAIDLAAQICRGLEFAHSKGIVHRDLKPGNIWLTSDGTAKIGDFGLAVAIDRSRLTQEGMMVGTVSYMPPEQAMGGDVTPQSDLYSLGAMLYEMVCGRPPFLGDDSVAIIGQHINTPPVAPTWHNSECPRALEALILRLLTKDPSERPESAADVLTALEGIDLTMTAEPSAEHDEAHALDSLAGGVFVGRQREMGELKAALEDALSGRGRLVTLVGEPGIGKTRTAQELATYAGLRGCQVLWGRCHESRGAPPYWPWVQAIRSYVRERDPERLRSEMGTGAADIAEIVSDVRERIPDLKPSPAVDDPEQARFRLFDSVTAFLKSASRGQPLVIILDNLHWADKPSLLLLEFLAQEFSDSRLLVIGTYRDVDLSRQHPLVETLGELTRERLFQRVLLRGLSQQDVGRFIEVTSGISPPRGLVRAVHTQTEGNPLFVTEVVRLLVQEGELTQERAAERDSWDVRIPEGVREVIGRRLNRLSARCNETLTIASVIGREFELRQLVRLVEEMSEERLLEALEEALSSRVIEELPQAVGRYTFTHALIQQTLYEELSTTQRVRLHARIAETLEQLYGESAEAHADELVHHFAQAEMVHGAAKLVKYSRIAGERALASFAHEDALVHFERALGSMDTEELDRPSAELLFGLGRSQTALSWYNEATESLSRAFQFFAEVGDIERAVDVLEYPFLLVAGSTRRNIGSLIERALPLVRPDSHLAGRLLSIKGSHLGDAGGGGDYDSALEALSRALQIARQEKDEVLELQTLSHLVYLQFWNLRWEESIDDCIDTIQLAQSIGNASSEIALRYHSSVAFAVMGDLERAKQQGEALVSLAEKLRFRQPMSSSQMRMGWFSGLVGDWESARTYCERGLLAIEDDRILSGLALIEYELGNFDEGDALIEKLTEGVKAKTSLDSLAGPMLVSLALPVMARIGNPSQESLRLAEEISHDIVASSASVPMQQACARTGLALRAVSAGNIGEAQQQYSVIQSLGEWTILAHMGRRRVLGILAHTIGSLEGAQTHFEDSLAFCRKAGYRPELAWTCCDYADMLLERNDEGDRQKATCLLDESLAISSDLGMRPLMERVLSRKMSLQGIDLSSPQTSIDAVVSAVEVERPNLQSHAAPDGTVTIMFTDIEGSTAMTERLGDARAQDVLRIHNAIIREQVGSNEGFEVKSQGDGFMLAFSSAKRALECAIAIQEALTAHNAENPAEPIRVRIGLHTGEAIKEGEDFFGRTVILAARIACEASGGQILVSSLLKSLVESSGEFEFGEGQDVDLKGLAGTHRVFEVNLP